MLTEHFSDLTKTIVLHQRVGSKHGQLITVSKCDLLEALMTMTVTEMPE